MVHRGWRENLPEVLRKDWRSLRMRASVSMSAGREKPFGKALAPTIATIRGLHQ